MFMREWKGTRSYCLADVGKMDGWPIEKQTECPGSLVAARAPLNMTSIAGMTVCGVRSGLNYLDATRVDPVTHECPGMKQPCSNNTSAENTICIHPSMIDQCPITYLAVIDKANIRQPPEELAGAQYEISDFTDTKAIIYSKDTDNMPAIETLIDHDLPCLNSAAYRIPDYSYFYKLEVEVTEYADCASVDDRFSSIGLEVSEFDLQQEAGVIRTLEMLPKYENDVELLKEVRKSNDLSVYVRPTTSWSLACERNSATSKTAFFTTLYMAGINRSYKDYQSAFQWWNSDGGTHHSDEFYIDLEEELDRGFSVVFMIHQLIVFSINAAFILLACQYQTRAYTRKEMADNKACANRVNPFFGLGLLIELTYAFIIAAKLLHKNRQGTFEHLGSIQGTLEQCTDTRYVNFDLDALEEDFAQSNIQRNGTMFLIIDAGQALLIVAYMTCFSKLMDEQMQQGNRLNPDPDAGNQELGEYNPEADLPQEKVIQL